MKLYLAGPMTGYPRWNFDAFAKAAAELRAAGYEVISPAENDLANGFDPDAPTNEFTVEDYRRTLAEDLRIVCVEVDGVALLAGWYHSAGARAEAAAAQACKKPAQHFREWIHAATQEAAA